MADVLLVEDDDTLASSLSLALEVDGHAVRVARGLGAARAEAEAQDPDLVLLDLGLPDGDGMELCRELRARSSEAAILVLTARSALEARVDGLREGADDYVTKPFDLPELRARVEALLRRVGRHSTSAMGARELLSFGRLHLDVRAHTATCDEEAVELTALEVKLLRYLAEHRGETVTREALLRDVWGIRPDTRTRTIDVFVSRLRRLIEADPAQPAVLVSVRGVGYRLED